MQRYSFWPEIPYWSFQVTRFISQIEAGGANFEEMYRTCQKITPGDRDSFYREWQSVGSIIENKASKAEAKGNRASARSGFQRASTYYLISQMILSADDPRKLKSLEQVYHAFKKSIAHMNPRPEIVRLPYERTTLEAFYFPPSRGEARAPAIIFVNGGEMTASECYFWHGPAATEAGFGFLCFDQPGNALSLLRDGLTATPHSERFISPAIDYLSQRSDVDSSRIILLGAGLSGSCLAPRAAAADPRPAAVISTCAPYSLASSFEHTYPHRNEDYKNFVSKMLGAASPSVADIMKAAQPYGLEGILQKLKCPFLILQGIDDAQIVDPVKTAQHALDQAGSQVKRLEIINQDDFGGSLHCQLDNLHSAQDAIFNWLADIKISRPVQ
jgi:alpha-beta hydrolase superfamily lysophospholipase